MIQNEKQFSLAGGDPGWGKLCRKRAGLSAWLFATMLERADTKKPLV